MSDAAWTQAVTARQGWNSRAHPAETVVDTLGAGQTLCARVLVGLLRQKIRTFSSPAQLQRPQTCTRFGAFVHGEAIGPGIAATTR
jgi:fructoselysine 6-kinase